MVHTLIRRFSYAIGSLLILLACGCGGGGGSSASQGQTNSLVDPASSFTGTSSAALVTSGNAEDLAMGGFYGARTGGIIGALDKRVTKSTVRAAGIPARELVQNLKLAARRLAIPLNPEELRQRVTAGGGGKGLKRPATFDVTGSSGGVASYSLNIDDRKRQQGVSP